MVPGTKEDDTAQSKNHISVSSYTLNMAARSSKSKVDKYRIASN